MKLRLFFITFMLISSIVLSQPTADLEELQIQIESIQGIETVQVQDILTAFSAVEELSVNNSQFEFVKGLISAGLFEEVEPAQIVSAVNQAAIALDEGAPAAQVEDLILIAFQEPLSAGELLVGARALESLENTDIAADVYLELISYGLINHWKPGTIQATAEGLKKGHKSKVEVQKLALAMIIRIDQGLGNTSVSKMIDEEISYLKERYSIDDNENTLRRKAFAAMQRAIERGVSPGVARELSFTAVERNWSLNMIDAAFEGLIRASHEGLTPEKVATALNARFSTSVTDPARVVDDVLSFVRKNEQIKLAVIDRSRLQQLKVIEAAPDVEKKPDTKKPEPGPEIKNKTPVVPTPPGVQKTTPTPTQKTQSDRVLAALNLNMAMMQQTIQSFMGVPYLWGGSTRRGTDCSGFVQSVFREQGILLPRVSRQQYTVGNTISFNSLQYGDLVFFNKYGYGRITHVGIYMGNGYFVHASCSKGVTITKLNKPYYRTRFAGAKRVLTA